jgi:hypothetical protein
MMCRSCQSFEFSAQPSNASGVSYSALTGATFLTPEKYMEIVIAMRPAFFFTLADETFSHLSKRRAELAASRTAAWTKECLRLAAGGHNGSDSSGGIGTWHGHAIGSVAGHAVPIQGRRVAQSIAEFDDQLAGALPHRLTLF